MTRAGVKNATYEVFQSAAEARFYCLACGLAPASAHSRSAKKLVVKADGLAAGKGAYVCRSLDEADAAITLMLGERVFGSAADSIIVEDFLYGPEFSLNGFADSSTETWQWLPMAQDHKTIFDADLGPRHRWHGRLCAGGREAAHFRSC